ncbi:MAG: anthranilate phosphoribosyltransferase [Candidatus Omnitrophica bacterium]|nr:anthranilate phosphoribosyltransferase [Candidatus Omnitrophota bacterium]
MGIKTSISRLVDKKDLSFQEAKLVFEDIFEDKAEETQIAAFFTALKIKQETEAELSAAVDVIRARSKKINSRDRFLGVTDKDDCLFDTCGTGGSGVNKFNISTAVAFVVSSLGIKVAKHGNKAMSSNCGSADVLESLGVNILADSSVMESAIKDIGFCFLYAPMYHSALAKVAKIRRDLGIRTIFNILGPLCSPAELTHQLLGVYSRSFVPVVARVLKRAGIRSAFVVYSEDLKDEISLSAPTFVAHLKGKTVKNFTLKASDFGLKPLKLKDLEVKNAKESARVIQEIFKGVKGPKRDIVLANASSCFYILGRVKTLKAGVVLASDLIDSGKVIKQFNNFKKFVKN